jgi:putative transposase
MEQRESFILDWVNCEESFVQLCRRYGIHRSKGYKWRARFLREGMVGLIERSRAPKAHPNQTPAHLAELLIDLRRQHPRWGAAKLLRILSDKHPSESWPAPSTAHEILRRANLVTSCKRKRRPGEYTDSLAGYYGPNAVWGADFKGHFFTRDKSRCVPLTISDICSRYLLRCDGLEHGDTPLTWKAFERVFCEHGLPDAIRTDNGGPFSSPSGLSELSVWWIKLGIRPERITRGRPTENGTHERIHKTMDDEDATAPQADLRQQQKQFDHFRKTYNELRPHRALAMKTPAQVYQQSTRPYPVKLRSPEYNDGYRVQRVNNDGRISINGEEIYLSRLISGEPVGLRDTEDGTQIWYGPQILGTTNAKGELRRGLPKVSYTKPSVLTHLEGDV